MDLRVPGVKTNMSPESGKRFPHSTGDIFAKRCAVTKTSLRMEPSCSYGLLGQHAATRKWFDGAYARSRRGTAESTRKWFNRATEGGATAVRWRIPIFSVRLQVRGIASSATFAVCSASGSTSTLTRASRGFSSANPARANAPSSDNEPQMGSRKINDLVREKGERAFAQSAANQAKKEI